MGIQRKAAMLIAASSVLLSVAVAAPTALAQPSGGGGDESTEIAVTESSQPSISQPPEASETTTVLPSTTVPTTDEQPLPSTTGEVPSTSVAPTTSEAPTTSTPPPAAPGRRLAPAAALAGCQTYPPTSFQVCGRIKDKYNQTGGPAGFLLFPKSNELTNPGNTGKRTEFIGGNIYWSAATDAHPVAHEFLTKWGEKGYEGGYLKYPTTDEIVLPDGINRRQEYQGGSIYWAAGIGAHTIQGAIKDKWTALGAQGGALGFPTSDEIVAPDGRGRFNNFQNGAIYWSPSTGAYSVGKSVLKAWGEAGFERGRFGYPIAEQTSPDNGATVQQRFQNGTITAPGPKTIQLSGLMQGTTPERVLKDAIDAAADAAAPLQEAIDGALVEAGDSNHTGPRDPDDAVPLPAARGKGDLFYSDAGSGRWGWQYEHGHNGIYVNTTYTIQALDPERGVQLRLGTDPDNVNHNPKLMWVNTTDTIRNQAIGFAETKIGSGYNNNFAFSRRDWEYQEPGETYNCSQLVWAAYMNASAGDVDIDGDGGWGVYPKDILEDEQITLYPED